MSTDNLDAFTRGYLECALWSSVTDDGEPFDYGRTVGNIAPAALAAAIADCEDFKRANAQHLALWTAEQAGHDFWLTRNHHGAGFWDRGKGEPGRLLTEAAHVYGSLDLHLGDDGLIYGMGE